jgi:hypothetical protein
MLAYVVAEEIVQPNNDPLEPLKDILDTIVAPIEFIGELDYEITNAIADIF